MFALPSRPRSDSHSLTHSPSMSFPQSAYCHTGASTEHGGDAANMYHTSSARQDNYSPTLRSGSQIPEQFTYSNHTEPSSSHSVFQQSHHRERVDSSRDLQRHKPSGPSTAATLNARRSDGPLMIDTYNLGVNYPPPSSHFETSGASSDHSIDADTWPLLVKTTSPASRPRRPRREKPRIDLAPDQPPTTQGKPRARVYVACLQCRTRKIRCDGAKPACHNCARRATGNSDCNYDPVPKRRGPDKTPGARQRLAKDLKNEEESGGPVRRRRRTRDTPSGKAKSDDQQEISSSTTRSRSGSASFPSAPLPHLPTTINSNPHAPGDFTPVLGFARTAGQSYQEPNSTRLIDHREFLEPNHSEKRAAVAYDGAFDLSSILPLTGIVHPKSVRHSRIAQLDDDGGEVQQDDTPDIGSSPSLIFSRKIWWDSLLQLYVSPASTRRQALTPSQRQSAAHGITSDIRFLFRASNYWFSFFHIPSFFANYFDPTKRERIQPSLILALLAMATFWQSSELGLSRHGRDRALRFRDEAQSALDASFNAGWIDETLAQAAWLLALFEVCAHPLHSSERVTSSLVMLDSIIRSLSLTFVDADDPNTSVFSPGTVPVVPERPRNVPWFPDPSLAGVIPSSSQESLQAHSPLKATSDGCSCKAVTLVEFWPEGNEHAPLWNSTPAWSSSWSEGEIRKESCRRLCWSSMILAAGHASYTTAHRSSTLNLFISDPSNYALLFSGESVASSPFSSKDTIWALHDRSFLLWHGCTQMRRNDRASDLDKAQFAVRAWLEADALESALNKHTCELERAFIFQGREYIFNTRMCISHEFQRYIPLVSSNVSGLFHRKKAEDWLTHQSTVAERFMRGLHTITGNSNNLLARRPFFVFWFMGQISRALSLWECDNTLTIAMSVCKALLPALDYLTALWPCPEQRYRYESLRERLANACYVAGVNPPLPPNLTLPPPSSPSVMV